MKLEKIFNDIEKESTTLKIFAKEYININFQTINTLLRKKKIKINNKISKDINQTILKGDKISIYSTINVDSDKKNNCEISKNLLNKVKSMIVYDDDKIIAINKNIIISTQKEVYNKASLIDIVRKIYNNDEIRIVHRLDKYVMGIIVFAKTKESAQEICAMFKDRRIKKEYIAITDKNVKFSETLCIEPLKDGEKKLSAETKFELIEKIKNFNIIKCAPLTGRKHQIRKHMAFLNISILGDIRYGGSKMNSKENKNQIALFSSKLEIPKYCNLFIDFYETIKHLIKKNIKYETNKI